MKKLIVVITILFIATTAMAQSSPDYNKIVVDKSSLTPEQLATAQKANKASTVVEEASDWVGVGKELGEAFNAGLGAITEHAEGLSETNVGKFTMLLIAYKVIGADLVQFLVGVPLLIVCLITWIRLIRVNLMRRRVLVSEDKANKIKTYNIYDPDPSAETQTAYYFMATVNIGLCVLIIFV